VFDGSARWLEISARPSGSANPFTNTFPRQAITAAPYAAFANNGMPAGAITAFAGTTVPAGWLLCDGSAVSRTNYARLFAAVGTTWGSGDGMTSFNLPDMRGMFLRGAGTHATQAKAAGGNFAGGNVGEFQADKMQAHKHDTGVAASPYKYFAAEYSAPYSAYSTPATSSSPVTDSANGTPRTGNETKPASYSVNYIIKY
jgi:microcystin-dependent protein